MPTYPITTPVADLTFEMRQTFAGEFVFVKNAYIAYLLDNTGFTQVTDIDYPGYRSISVSSITRSSTTATVTTATDHGWDTGLNITIAGATQTEYNGTFEITVTGTNTFTYTVSGAPATPATGTITASGGWTTVPGIVYLDDYIFVGRADGEIHNSNRSAYSTWDALDFITPEKEPSLLVAIAKSLNFLVAFKQWDTEFFYDAEVAPPGSPLLPQDSAYLKLGCASAQSVVEFDGGIIFVSKRDQLQRSREVHMLSGLTPKKISTPEIERILNASDLSEVYSLYLSTAGHQLYILTLVDIEITLVCDLGNGFWGQWTILTAQSSQNVTGIYREEATAIVMLENHGYADGDPVVIAGATPDGYNGTFNITVIDDNNFSYPVDSTLDTPASGTITATGYDESYFPAVAYATYQNLDLVQHETNGYIYALDVELYEDTGVPINFILRMPPWDNGNKERKTISHIKPIGYLTDSTALVRYTDDDYDSYSHYRRVAVSSNASQIRKLGNTRRRAWEVRHTEDAFFAVDALDMNFNQGF